MQREAEPGATRLDGAVIERSLANEMSDRMRAAGAFGMIGTLMSYVPAAPMTDVVIDGNQVTISWDTGTDLGECGYPDTITDPAEVEVVRWEIVVEPNEDELPDGELPEDVPFSVFMVQLPAGARSVQVPIEWIDNYLMNGVDQFKYEVGAREESGNQTFTEEEFEM